MFSPDNSLVIGPVRCAWRHYQHGTPAETLVRPWLATALDVPLDGLALQRDPHGRPRLLEPLRGFDVSWSHSGERLLVALGNAVQLGADLELLRPRPRALVLAQRFFAATEAATLAAWPAATREAAFVRLWCAKEAVLKAHGRGLAFGLDRLTFAEHNGAWTLVTCDPELGVPADWTLHAFTPMPGYLATLAWRLQAGATPPVPAVDPVW